MSLGFYTQGYVFLFFFKKATVGQCNTKKPGMMDMVGRYKWSAWNDLGSMSQVSPLYMDMLE